MAKYIYKKYEVEETQILTRYEQKEIFMREAPPTQGNKYFSKCEFDAELGRFHLSEERSWRGSFTPYDIIAGMTYIMGKTIFEAVYKFERVIEPSGREKYEQYRLEAEPVYRTEYSKGNYIGTVTAEDGTYPRDGKSGSYWYVRDRLANRPPTISGSNLNIGSKTDDFQIEYIVNDPDGDRVTVDIHVDNVKKVNKKVVTLGVRNYYNIAIEDYTLGKHTIKITASDGKASPVTRTYTFNKSNTAPEISGNDEFLGEKSLAFSIDYTVTDKNNDDVYVTVTLGDIEIQTISSAQDKELSVTITDELLADLIVGNTYTITIKADDGKGGIAYRRYTFTRANKLPIISGSNGDLGEKLEAFTKTFSITDIEKDQLSFNVFLDDDLFMEELKAVDSKEYSIDVDHDTFIRLPYGKHTIRIVAWDSEHTETSVERLYEFTRVPNGLEVEVKINEFPVKPEKILAVYHGAFKADAIIKMEACNNYLDNTPAWEDITTASKSASAHTFSNSTKTNDKWSIGIRLIVENGTEPLNIDDLWFSYADGINGGYE